MSGSFSGAGETGGPEPSRQDLKDDLVYLRMRTDKIYDRVGTKVGRPELYSVLTLLVLGVLGAAFGG